MSSMTAEIDWRIEGAELNMSASSEIESLKIAAPRENQ